MTTKSTNIVDTIRNIYKLLLAQKPVLNVEEAAMYCGLSQSYLYKLAYLKQVPYYKSKGGKLIYFKKSELEDWMLYLKVKTNDEIALDANEYLNLKAN